ncbi:MAG: NAD-dependent deacylase, partial [Flavobacteriia bacterium]
ASPYGWNKNPELVLDFYNKRRRQLLEVKPNKAHKLLAELEKYYNVDIITQNVDDLHERAGSSHVLHLHGELFKVRSTEDEDLIYEWKKDLKLGDVCKFGSQLRPHIVWFGEAVPMLEKGIEIARKADIFIVIGTSMQVYPAAGLIQYTPRGIPLYYIDPDPAVSFSHYHQVNIIDKIASEGMQKLFKELTTA